MGCTAPSCTKRESHCSGGTPADARDAATLSGLLNALMATIRLSNLVRATRRATWSKSKLASTSVSMATVMVSPPSVR